MVEMVKEQLVKCKFKENRIHIYHVIILDNVHMIAFQFWYKTGFAFMFQLRDVELKNHINKKP